MVFRECGQSSSSSSLLPPRSCYHYQFHWSLEDSTIIVSINIIITVFVSGKALLRHVSLLSIPTPWIREEASCGAWLITKGLYGP